MQIRLLKPVIMVILLSLLLFACNENDSQSSSADPEPEDTTYDYYEVNEPVFSLDSGEYTAFQTLSISSENDGATEIYYTTDSTTPTAKSTAYTGPIEINISMTVNAVAIVDSKYSSAVKSATYNFRTGKPICSLSTRYFTTPQTISFTSETPDASIYYVTYQLPMYIWDPTGQMSGTPPASIVPTISSPKFTDPLTISETISIETFAARADMKNSEIVDYRFVYYSNELVKIIPPSGGMIANFGTNVCVSSDGTKALVGPRVLSKTNGSWGTVQLAPSGASAAGFFISSVGMSADGLRVAVGSYMAESAKGAVYIFDWNGASWTETAKLTASDGAANHKFGQSLDLSPDGTKIIVGSPCSPTNCAYVYTLSGSTWDESRLTPSKAYPSSVSKYPSITNYFEQPESVAISSDGLKAVVGIPFTTDSEGTVYVFSRNGSTWTEDRITNFEKDSVLHDYRFGISVDMTADGNQIIIGADGQTISPEYGYPYEANGAAYLYKLNGSAWELSESFSPKSINYLDSNFGRSVSISSDGTRVLVGAIFSSGMANKGKSGDAYLFRLTSTGWIESKSFYASDSESNDLFGSNVAISGSGNVVIIGAPGDDDAGTDSGAMYIFSAQ